MPPNPDPVYDRHWLNRYCGSCGGRRLFRLTENQVIVWALCVKCDALLERELVKEER